MSWNDLYSQFDYTYNFKAAAKLKFLSWIGHFSTVSLKNTWKKVYKLMNITELNDIYL